MRLTSVDLPTLGRPTTATTGTETGTEVGEVSLVIGVCSLLSGLLARVRYAAALMGQPDDDVDHLVQVQLGGIDLHRVVGLTALRGVQAIAAVLLDLGGGGRPADLGGPAVSPGRAIGGEEHLDRSIGCDHGADVAPLGHDPVRLGDDVPLLRDKVRADPRDRGHGADRAGHLAGPDRRRHVGAIDPGPRRARVGADLDDWFGGQLADQAGVTDGYAPLEQPPGQGPVHGPGVQIPHAQGDRRAPRGARLARARGSVDRHDEPGLVTRVALLAGAAVQVRRNLHSCDATGGRGLEERAMPLGAGGGGTGDATGAGWRNGSMLPADGTWRDE